MKRLPSSALVLLAACGVGGDGGPRADLAGAVRDSAGVRIVEHADLFGADLPVWTIAAAPLLIVGDVEEEALYRVRGAALLSDGSLVVKQALVDGWGDSMPPKDHPPCEPTGSWTIGGISCPRVTRERPNRREWALRGRGRQGNGEDPHAYPLGICLPPEHIAPMDLPEDVLERFRAHGRAGGRRRAERMSAEARSAAARRAATVRWIRHRFGAASFERLGLPGGELVDAGLADLADGEETPESLAVSLAAPRLRREGVPVGDVLPDPEWRLWQSLSRTEGDLAHARYNAYLRRLVSFADACRLARVDREHG